MTQLALQTPAYSTPSGDIQIFQGDALEVLRKLPDQAAQTCVTSPPYWGLRDYGVPGQLGLEPTPEEYVDKLIQIFREVRRVLRNDGTLWLNLGDTYASSKLKSSYRGETSDLGWSNQASRKPPTGLKPKDLVGIPWRVAFALQADGWLLRQDIIWHKPNPMPESVSDRCTKAHEYIFLLTKSNSYHFDQLAIQEPASPNTHARLARAKPHHQGSTRANGNSRSNRPIGPTLRKFDPRKGNKNNPSFDSAMAVMPPNRNKRSVWSVTTKGFKEAHFATFPPQLIQPCIIAGAPPHATVLDPFSGAATTQLVALQTLRRSIGIELNPDYIAIATKRLNAELNKQPLFN